MPTRDQIVQVPFVGGIDESSDPDQLQPPGMDSLVNAVVRKPGRIEKREGFSFINKIGTTNVPAGAFGGSDTYLPPYYPEALASHNDEEGSRLVVAAADTLYEYVGQSANKGWRQVNELPACYGTLKPIDATGGTITETESVCIGNLRFTSWIIGVRNGQDMTNDSAINSQTLPDAGLYISVQRIDNGAFVTAPTRITDPGGSSMGSCSDLRMCKAPPQSDAAGGVIVFWRAIKVALLGLVVLSDGSIQPTRNILAFAGRNYHRSYDITYYPNGKYLMLFACDAESVAFNETVTVTPYTVTATGVFSAFAAPWDFFTAIGASGVNATYTWVNSKVRGVVVEADPDGTQIAFSVRALYKKLGGDLIDGKMIVGALNVLTPPAYGLSVTSQAFGVVNKIGFKTDESLVSSFTGAPGSKAKSSSVTMRTDIVHPNSNLGPSANNILITGTFSDGTVEVYYADGVQSFQRKYTNLRPYKWAESPYSSNYLQTKQTHTYEGTSGKAIINAPVPQAAAFPAGTVKINKQQITRLVFNPAYTQAAAAGYLVTADLYRGVKYCTAMMAFNGAGNLIAATITDGNPGSPVAVDPSPGGIDIFDWFVISSTYIGTGVPGPAPTGLYAFGAGNMTAHADLNSSSPYTSVVIGEDIAGKTEIESQTYFDTLFPPERCVHRWDVVSQGTSPNRILLALSSTSAGVTSNPNADVPLGYASPFAENNFFEVYEYPNAGAGVLLNTYAYGTTQYLVAALGGPWRLIGGLTKYPFTALNNLQKYYCVITPSGDDYQRSAFLVSFTRPAQLRSVTSPDTVSTNPESFYPTGVEGYRYSGNSGVFVESLNMPRTAAVPLNVPRMSAFDTSLTFEGVSLSVAAIRQGQDTSGSEVFGIDYTFKPHQWRSIKSWGDYSVINGGIVTLFDGSGANEISMLLWPQRDLTSVAYERAPTKLYSVDPNSTQQYASTQNGPNAFGNPAGAPYLRNISRPWFAYEAGFNNAYGIRNNREVDMSWGLMSTYWGGKATDSFEAVYTDPRMLQVSQFSKPSPAAGLAETATQHYYGRYQSGYSTGEVTTLGNSRLVIWAPRSAPGVATPAASNYSPIVANGDFLIRWCYEVVDGTGRVARSAPSQACTFTICASIRYDKDQYGGVVDEYRYGFYVPRLELTNRLKTAESDSKRVVMQPYVTAEPFSTVFYKMPFSNFLDGYAGSFIVDRNVTRGVVRYASAPKDTFGQLGIVTNNFKCFDGPQKEYNGVLTQPTLYTVGGTLDNVPPPSALCMTVHQNRLVLGGADDATVVWFSKELSPVDAPGFNDAFTIQIEDGGPITGVASLESMLVVFKRDSAWILPGDMPDDTGAAINRGYVSNTLGTPVRMPHGIGCVDHRSVVETPVGIFFKSRRSIELLSRDMSITPVGLKVDDLLTQYPLSCIGVHNARETEVSFSVSGEVDGIGFAHRILVYNYRTDTWAEHQVPEANSVMNALPVGVISGDVCFAASWSDFPEPTLPSQTVVYRQTQNKFFDVRPDGRQYVVMRGRTAPISLNNIQGFQRVKRIRLIGDPIPTVRTGATQAREPHGMNIILQTDYALAGDNDGYQEVSWTVAQVAAVYDVQSREIFEIHVKEQKGQKITVDFTEVAPANINTLGHGYGTAFSNMALVVGLKTGLDKRITSEAKH